MHADWAIERVADTAASRGWRQRRATRSVCRALSRVPAGAPVLDLPCGSGRWLELFARRGFQVTCADPSESALDGASRRWHEIAQSSRVNSPEPTFVRVDPLQTGFPSRHFAAVVCTDFFDRQGMSELRIEALRELRRISRGPVVVSFCNAFALGSLPLGMRRQRAAEGVRSHVPVPVWAFLNDLRRAGLNPIARHAVLWGISPLWHIVSVPASGRVDGWLGTPRTERAKAA